MIDARLKCVEDWIEAILDVEDDLTEWEYNFVESVTGQYERTKYLSTKQIDIIERIYAEKTK